MNIAPHKPRMTRDEFLVWVETQDRRYEFDGFEPVAMVGGTINHSRIYEDVDLPDAAGHLSGPAGEVGARQRPG